MFLSLLQLYVFSIRAIWLSFYQFSYTKDDCLPNGSGAALLACAQDVLIIHKLPTFMLIIKNIVLVGTC